jgi:hypothetical protein
MFLLRHDIVDAMSASPIHWHRLQCRPLTAAGEAGIARMPELQEDEVPRCSALLGTIRSPNSTNSICAPRRPICRTSSAHIRYWKLRHGY